MQKSNPGYQVCNATSIYIGWKQELGPEFRFRPRLLKDPWIRTDNCVYMITIPSSRSVIDSR